MTAAKDGSENSDESRLPRRDWILLPALGLLTIFLMAGSSELLSRLAFRRTARSVGSCIVVNDPSTGARGIPNCVIRVQGVEGPSVEYRFNSCGHRAGMECGPKPSGAYRIVMAGSSIALGELVPWEQTFAALLPREISARTGRNVELYNEGMGWGFPHSTTLKFNNVLAAQPDLILWMLNPVDIQRTSEVLPTADLDPWPTLSLPAKAWKRLQADVAAGSPAATASELFGRTRTAFILRHWLYESPSLYLESFLAADDSQAGFLKVQHSALWKSRLTHFDSDAADIEARARTAGVPFVAFLVPTRAQAAMISMGEWPKGYDPYKLGDEVHAIVASHGGIYLDILQDFRNIPNAAQYFYPVDTHPDARAHAIISALVAKALTDGSVPALKAPSNPLLVSEKSK